MTQSPTTDSVARLASAAPSDDNPVAAAFAYGDLLDAVQYQLGFEPEARDAAALRSSCDAVLAADAPGAQLSEAAAPIVRFCRTGDEDLATQAGPAYANYRDAVFNLAS